eukprot:snap_masked-scaffold29_size597861-processed-gene-1.10 protein:Tk04645 transcript:snap_masked-scaffold29_size597861-processed-gene-1.10-mRNA-1 annotation:"pickpocket protein 28 isoform x1"
MASSRSLRAMKWASAAASTSLVALPVRASQALRIQEELSQNPQSDWIKTEHLFVHEVCGHFNDDFLDDRDNLNLTGQALHHFLNELGQPCSDMLIRCRFEGLERNCTDIFVPVITDEGQCCSFNVMPESVMFRNEVDRDEAEEKRWSLWDMQSGYVEDPRQVQVDLPDEYLPRRALAPGLHMGLSVLLDVDEEEYYCSGTESVGFKALLHTPVTLPEMIEYGFAITPGTETFLAVSPKLIHADENIHGISYLKRQCYLTGEKDLSFFRHYTFLNCYMECVANYTFSACGCVDYYMPRNPDLMPICSTNKGECIQRAVTLVEKSAYSKFDGNVSTCGCLPPCSDMNFPHETSTSKLRGDLLKVSNQLKGKVNYQNTMGFPSAGTFHRYSLFSKNNQHKLGTACGCVDYYVPRNPDLMPICSTNKGECIQRAVTLVEKSAYSKFDGNVSTCGCLPPCSDMNFPHETSTSKLRGDLLKVSNQLKVFYDRKM